MPSTSLLGRLLAPRPLAVLALAAALAGCASSRPDGWTEEARPARADTTDSPARVGLAATMEIPDNPYGDTAAVEVPAAEDIASGAVPLGNGGVDPDAISVGRYYYDDEGTTYYEDVADDLADDGQGWDDDVYYGGYDAGYYRYSDPAFFPSPYRYYRPYATYRPYVRFGWYPTWHYRRSWHNPYYAGYGYYDPYYFDPYAYAAYGPYGYGTYDPFFGPSVVVSVGYGYGHGGGYYASSGYYGPGYYGRPRHRGYYDGFRGDDDGTRSRVRGLPGTRTSPIAQSQPDPSRQPARRGLAPARLPRPSVDRGITRSTGRRTAPDRADRPDRSLPDRAQPDRADRPVRSGGRTTPSADPGRAAPPVRSGGRTTPTADPGRTVTRTPSDAPPRRAAPRRTNPREDAPRRAEPRRDTRPAPAPRRETRQAPAPRRETRQEPAPRRETRPAPAPRRETSQPAPPPRRESRPAPAPRQESRPAPRPAPRTESRPAPRRETSRPAPSRSGGNRSTGSRSRRGGNN